MNNKLVNIFFFSLFFYINIFAVEYTVNTLPHPKTYNTANFVSNPDGILKTFTESQLNILLSSLENDTQAEVVVVAVNSIGNEDVKNFAVKLFEKWRIGKAGVDNGLLILFVLDQRIIVFETGYGLEGILPDAIASRIINQQILPQFRNGNYDAGMIAGVKRVSSIIREEPVSSSAEESINWRVALPVVIAVYIIWALLSFFWMGSAIKKIKTEVKYPNNVARYYAVKRRRSVITNIMAFIFPLISFFLVVFFFGPLYLLFLLPLPFTAIPANIYGRIQMKKVRTQPLPCEKCGGMMHILSEKKEDTYLNEAQKFEEKLNSVDYDVYKCDSCDEIKIFKIDRISPYSICPKCGTKAFIEHKKETIQPPTYSSTGVERVTYKCKFCGYEEHKNRTIPRLQRSTGAFIGGMAAGSILGKGGGGFGGGSFGGGRSGGGGATGRW